jgi:hypothetical protein
MALAFANSAAGQASQRYAGVVDQILAAWKSADVVCRGEDHDRNFDNELRVAVVRHPAFAKMVSSFQPFIGERSVETRHVRTSTR